MTLVVNALHEIITLLLILKHHFVFIAFETLKDYKDGRYPVTKKFLIDFLNEVTEFEILCFLTCTKIYGLYLTIVYYSVMIRIIVNWQLVLVVDVDRVICHS